MTVYELVLMPEHGAWQEHRVGLFWTEEEAWQWAREHTSDEREMRYLYAVEPRVIGEAIPVPWFTR